MKRFTLWRWFVLGALILVAVAQSATAETQDVGPDGRTDALPYVVSLNNDYQIIPLLTTEDEVPLLQGAFGAYTVSPTQTIAMSGIPDGLGLVETEDAYYVFMNHELSATTVTQVSSTISGTITGARVSIVQFNKAWQVVGAKNLIERIETADSTYTLNLATGQYEDGQSGTFSLNRFCSGFLAAEGFVGLDDQAAPVWFGPEEYSPNGLGWAVYPDGTAVSIDGLGRYAKEQVYAPVNYRAGSASNTTVLLSTEDTADGELYMYVGQQTPQDPNGFAHGDLYVLRVETATGMIFDYETMTESVELVAAWTPISETIALSDGAVLSDWVNTDQRSTNFRRLEDLHEDPNTLGTFYFVTTGRTDVPPGMTQPDNLYGKLYQLILDPTDPTANGTIELVLNGGPDTGVSYDNLVVDSLGNVLIQEDRTAGGDDVMNSQQRMAYVWSYSIADDTVEPWFATNQAQVDPSVATDYGNWETSGIIEAGVNQQLGLSSYLLTVQAHSLPSASQAEKGQLLAVVPIVRNNTLFLPYISR